MDNKIGENSKVNRRKLIEFSRNTLARLDKELNDEHGNLNRKLYSDALDAFSIIASEKLYELEPEVFKALECKDEDIREEAILTLAFNTRLGVPRFREMAHKIWLEDESWKVRETALCGWAAYYTGTKNPKVLKEMYSILKNENYPIDVRYRALFSIFNITREKSNFFDLYANKLHFTYPEPTQEEFNKKIDWDEMKTLMRKYAPEAVDGNNGNT